MVLSITGVIFFQPTRGRQVPTIVWGHLFSSSILRFVSIINLVRTGYLELVMTFSLVFSGFIFINIYSPSGDILV